MSDTATNLKPGMLARILDISWPEPWHLFNANALDAWDGAKGSLITDLEMHDHVTLTGFRRQVGGWAVAAETKSTSAWNGPRSLDYLALRKIMRSGTVVLVVDGPITKTCLRPAGCADQAGLRPSAGPVINNRQTLMLTFYKALIDQKLYWIDLFCLEDCSPA